MSGQPASDDGRDRDPNARDPNARDPNARDPNARDPNARDPNARDPDLFDRAAFDRAAEAARAAAGSLPPRALRSLAQEVVSRLATRAAPGAPGPDDVPGHEIDRLCAAFLGPDEAAAPRMVAALRAEGVPVETIYLGYLARVAERLGTLWEEDRASFLEVTLAVARIYGVLRGLRGALLQARRPSRLSALFAPVPGEQHTLGITMAADLLRARGWEITLKLGLDHEALAEAAARSDHPVIGLSAGGQRSLVPLARAIVAIRVARPEALILLGGNLARADAETRPLLDVDVLAPDVATADRDLERLRALLITRG